MIFCMDTVNYRYGDVSVWVAPIPAYAGLSKRECERRAEADLLLQVFGRETKLLHDDDGKPYLPDSHLHISISHSKNRLCIALSESTEIGVDIEDLHPRLDRVKHMFLTDIEQSALPAGLLPLALCWSAKEAVYKLLGKEAGAMGENVKLDIDSLCQALHSEVSTTSDVCYPCFYAKVHNEQCRLLIIEQNNEFEIVLACRYMTRY